MGRIYRIAIGTEMMQKVYAGLPIRLTNSNLCLGMNPQPIL
jgi:hypothetical protein